MEHLLVPYESSSLIEANGVLVFAPHPDDEVFGPGGALALYAQAGIPVAVVVLTDGAFGKEGVARTQWLELREAESCLAAAVLGISPPLFWRIPDRQLAFGETLIDRMLDAILHTGADLVFATALTEMHPDHRVTGMAAVEAVRRLGGVARLAMYEVGVPISSPSLLLNISSVLDKKEAAMACFGSQLAIQRYAEQISALNRFRTYTLPPDVIAAEAFQIWDPVCDASPWQTLFESEAFRRQRLGLLMETGDHLPLVNVIICSFDHPLLTDALNSVACLTHGNIVVTVVNAKGGRHSMQDNCCGPFRLRLLNQDGGALNFVEAANVALDCCHEGFGLFLDETQQLDPKHISVLLFELVHHPRCTAAFHGSSFLDLIEKKHASTKACPRELNFMLLNSILFRIHTQDGGGCRFDPAMLPLQDWDFLLQLSQFGDFRNVLKGVDESCWLACMQETEVMGEAHLAMVAKWASIGGGRMMSKALVNLNARLAQTLSEKQLLLRQLEQERLAFEAVTIELEQMRSSRSWQVTAPLRSFRSRWFGPRQ